MKATKLIAGLILGVSLPALAQAQDAAPSTGEIIVTARRTAEKLQDVPVSVEALSQKALTERSVTSATDLGRVVSGLVANADTGNPSLVTFSIRGRGQTYGAATGSVETYFGDIPLSSTYQIPSPPPQFFDLDAMQVLKGPQGTLFGRNTTGGAVVMTPRAPKLDTTEGYVRVQGGTYGDFQFEGAVNIPLGTKAALRLAAFDWQREGYMHSSAIDIYTGATQVDNTTGKVIGAQTYNNVDTTQLRASLLLEPSSTVRNTTVLSYLIDKNRSSTGAGLMQGPRTTPTAANPYGVTVVAEPNCGTYCDYVDVNLDKPASHYILLENTSTVQVNDAVSVKNIFGYVRSVGYTNDATDADGTSLAFVDLPAPPRPKHNDQYSDEVQVQGKAFDDKANLLVGGMYDRTAQPTGLDTVNAYSVSNSGAASNYLNAVNFESTNVTNKSLYASLTIKPLAGLNLTGGYRHTWIDLSQYEGFAASPEGDPLPMSPPSLSVKVGSYQGDTYNIGVDYHIDPDLMVYGGYRHGFKRGGFNPAALDNSSFAPETVDDFTLGLKSKFTAATMPVRFNIEFFYDNYYDMQTNYLALGAGQLSTYTVNIPKVRYQGFDADINIDPTRWLTLSAAYSYNDAKIVSWPDPSAPAGTTPANLANNPVPFDIKNKVTVTGRLHDTLPGNTGEGVFQLSFNYQSKFYNNGNAFTEPYGTSSAFYFNSPASFCAGGLCGSTMPGYATVDMRVELNHAFGSRFDLAAAATNLTNKLYYTGSSSTLDFGFEGFSYGPPRMFTFEVSTRF
jgi:iron complex outermembrane recepter protein